MRTAFWLVRALAVIFNIAMAAILWSARASLLNQGFDQGWGVPLMVRGPIVMILLFGPVLSVVAIFWRR